MREVIIIISVIALVVAGSMLMQRYLEQTSDELISILEEIKSDIENLEKTKTLSEELLAKWNEINKVWSTIIIHEELDNIELSMLGLKGAIISGDSDDATEEIERTIFLVGHIKEKEAFKLKNIF